MTVSEGEIRAVDVDVVYTDATYRLMLIHFDYYLLIFIIYSGSGHRYAVIFSQHVASGAFAIIVSVSCLQIDAAT